jgi:hypothetical protein
MTGAIIVEIGRDAAGVAVQERGGFRFYAADAVFRPINDHKFPSLKALQRAAAVLGTAPRGGR